MKKQGDKETAPDGLWIAPRYSLKGAAGERAWTTGPAARRTVAGFWNWLISPLAWKAFRKKAKTSPCKHAWQKQDGTV